LRQFPVQKESGDSLRPRRRAAQGPDGGLAQDRFFVEQAEQPRLRLFAFECPARRQHLQARTFDRHRLVRVFREILQNRNERHGRVETVVAIRADQVGPLLAAEVRVVQQVRNGFDGRSCPQGRKRLHHQVELLLFARLRQCQQSLDADRAKTLDGPHEAIVEISVLAVVLDEGLHDQVGHAIGAGLRQGQRRGPPHSGVAVLQQAGNLCPTGGIVQPQPLDSQAAQVDRAVLQHGAESLLDVGVPERVQHAQRRNTGLERVLVLIEEFEERFSIFLTAPAQHILSPLPFRAVLACQCLDQLLVAKFPEFRP
jgi:hypothetical protein